MSGNKTRKQVKFIHPHMHHHLHQFLKAEVIDCFNPGMVKMVFIQTMVKVNGTIYRADLGGAFSNSYQCGRHDWVSIHWAMDDVCRDVRKITMHRGIPARIITFLEVPYITAECQDDMPYFYDGEGLYAVVASLAESLYATTTSTDGSEINHRCHQATQLVFHSQLEVDPKFSIPSSPGVKMPKLHVLKVDNDKFLNPVIAVPYFWKDKVNEIDWMFVEPRFNWDFLFDQCANELLPSTVKQFQQC
jgi:hypothetical protein